MARAGDRAEALSAAIRRSRRARATRRCGLHRRDARLEAVWASVLDALVEATVPGVRKAVKWNSPLYGMEGQGLASQLSLLHPLREGDLLPRRRAHAGPARNVATTGRPLP